MAKTTADNKFGNHFCLPPEIVPMFAEPLSVQAGFLEKAGRLVTRQKAAGLIPLLYANCLSRSKFSDGLPVASPKFAQPSGSKGGVPDGAVVAS